MRLKFFSRILLSTLAIMLLLAFANYGLANWGREAMTVITVLGGWLTIEMV